MDRKIRVRLPSPKWALWWQGGKRRLRTSRNPSQCRLGTLKPLAAHGIECPAAGQNLEPGQLSRHFIAEISLNATLNHNNQPTNQSNCTSLEWRGIHLSNGTSTERRGIHRSNDASLEWRSIYRSNGTFLAYRSIHRSSGTSQEWRGIYPSNMTFLERQNIYKLIISRMAKRSPVNLHISRMAKFVKEDMLHDLYIYI